MSESLDHAGRTPPSSSSSVYLHGQRCCPSMRIRRLTKSFWCWERKWFGAEFPWVVLGYPFLGGERSNPRPPSPCWVDHSASNGRRSALSCQLPDMHDDGTKEIKLVLWELWSVRFETRYDHLMDLGPIKPEIPQVTATGRGPINSYITSTFPPLLS